MRRHFDLAPDAGFKGDQVGGTMPGRQQSCAIGIIWRCLACMLRRRFTDCTAGRPHAQDPHQVQESLVPPHFCGGRRSRRGRRLCPQAGCSPRRKFRSNYAGLAAEGANVCRTRPSSSGPSGIEVTIEKGTGSAAATQAIAQGKYEFGIPAAPNSIQQAMKGLPLLSLGCFNYDTTMGVAVRPESPIKAPADLKGKKVARR